MAKSGLPKKYLKQAWAMARAGKIKKKSVLKKAWELYRKGKPGSITRAKPTGSKSGKSDRGGSRPMANNSPRRKTLAMKVNEVKRGVTAGGNAIMDLAADWGVEAATIYEDWKNGRIKDNPMILLDGLISFKTGFKPSDRTFDWNRFVLGYGPKVGRKIGKGLSDFVSSILS